MSDSGGFDTRASVSPRACEFVLVVSEKGRSADVADFLRTLPGVRNVRSILYGHFDLLVEIEGPSHAAVQALLANKVRFHEGVERIDELGDREEAETVLHALEAGHA